jgi:hypothetical protein
VHIVRALSNLMASFRVPETKVAPLPPPAVELAEWSLPPAESAPAPPPPPPPPSFVRRHAAILVVGTMSAVVVFGGAGGMRVLEGWSYLTALYFSVVTFLTIGFGDVVPTTKEGAQAAIDSCWGFFAF